MTSAPKKKTGVTTTTPAYGGDAVRLVAVAVAALLLGRASVGLVGPLSSSSSSSSQASPGVVTIEGTEDTLFSPKVVLISAMTSEIQRFVDRLPLGDAIDFPAGGSALPLRANLTLGVLGVVTGEGLRRASIAITALGHDPRFDLTDSFFLFAGIAGVDPNFGSMGSAFWARYAVHADWGTQFDAREIPEAFNGTTILPKNRDAPFGAPSPSAKERVGLVYHLPLAEYAFELTQNVTLLDSQSLAQSRAAYPQDSPAALPPAVRIGDVVTTNLYWAGDYLTEWARDWHDYYVYQKGKTTSSFATTAEEDTGIAEALNALARAGRVGGNASERLMILRTVSDYSAAPPNTDLVDWFFNSPDHYRSTAAFEAAYVVGSVVVFDLIRKD